MSNERRTTRGAEVPKSRRKVDSTKRARTSASKTGTSRSSASDASRAKKARAASGRRTVASSGASTDPAGVAPIYPRPPEAVTLWDRRHGVSA